MTGFIADTGIENVVFLSGDRHWFACRHLEDSMREYQVGPLAAGLGMYPDTFPPEVVASALVRNYGFIRIEPDDVSGTATLTFECIDENANVVYRESVTSPRVGSRPL